MCEEKKNLYREIRSFKRWAEKYYPDRDEENDNGEWEIGTDNHFDEMVDAALKVIENINSSDAGEDLIEALLFSIARDNECERLADELRNHEDWFELLAGKSLGTKYINAQWQLAKRVGEFENCKELIYKFIESDNEYTSRMSLQALAEIDPERAEEYAINFWNRGKYPEGSYEDEYQKIMALHVLYSIGSDKLAEYREKALVSPYKWLKANAEQMVCFAKQHK